jgi:hypothetical protein
LIVWAHGRKDKKAEAGETLHKQMSDVKSNQKQQLSFLNRVSEHGLDKAGDFGEPEFTYSK